MNKVESLKLLIFLLTAWQACERVYYRDGEVFVKNETGMWPDQFADSVAVTNVVPPLLASSSEEDAAASVSLAIASDVGFVKGKPAREASEDKPAKERGIGINKAGRALLSIPLKPETAQGSVFGGNAAEA